MCLLCLLKELEWATWCTHPNIYPWKEDSKLVLKLQSNWPMCYPFTHQVFHWFSLFMVAFWVSLLLRLKAHHGVAWHSSINAYKMINLVGMWVSWQATGEWLLLYVRGRFFLWKSWEILRWVWICIKIGTCFKLPCHGLLENQSYC